MNEQSMACASDGETRDKTSLREALAVVANGCCGVCWSVLARVAGGAITTFWPPALVNGKSCTRAEGICHGRITGCKGLDGCSI